MAGRYHLYTRKYKDKNGKESILWWYWYWDSGKRIRKPAAENGTAPRLKREAQAFLDRLEQPGEAAPKPDLSPPLPAHPPVFGAPRTFKEFAVTLYQPGAQHLRRKALTEGSEIDEKTRKAHRSQIENYLIPKWGSSIWKVFESDGFPDDFTDWLVDLTRFQIRKEGKEPEAPRTISNSLRNSIMETMSIALREAKRSRFIRMVPELERFARGSKHQDTLTDEELSKLFPEDKAQLEKIWRLEDGRDHDTGMLFGAMCCLGISAGLRSGELRAVSADQIIRKQLKNGEMLYGLIVDKALGDDQEIVGLKKAKADDLRVRVVMLSEKTMRTLDMYLESVPQREGLLFLHRGHPIRKETLGRRWAAGLRKAKISTVGRRLTPHSMRYTYNTRMRMLVSEQALQEMIGHKSEDMTALYDRPHLEERLYQLEDQRSSVEKFWERTTQH